MVEHRISLGQILVRELVAAMIVGLSIVAPALAQSEITPQQLADARATVDASGIDDSTYKVLWCAAVFNFEAMMLTKDGLSAKAKISGDASSALYSKATRGPLFHMEKEAAMKLGRDIGTIVYMQVTSADGVVEFDRDQCLGLLL